MDGGRTRDSVVLRAALAIACVALTAIIAAPAALAGSPAGDQYGSALPGGGNGSGSPNGSSSGSGTESTIPVAGESSSSGQGSGGSADTSGAGGTSSKTGSNGGSSHSGDQENSATGAGDDQSALSSQNTSHSVPQIAADSAGDSWVPFFIAALVALACAAGALVYRNRRRAAHG
jgi:hypothetical protein